MDIKLSVDGQDGEVLARDSGLLQAPEAIDQALVPLGNVTIDGQRGANARPAVPGSPSGLLVVELTESPAAQGSIHVQVVRYESRQQPGDPFDVPIHQDILLTAIGGNGEDGQAGSNGQRGRDGIDGTPASRAEDARNGTDAGNGGDAGAGTSGADGGDGGIVQLIVLENNIHLLMAAKYDVRGGKGGAPGQHGKPGDGGTGGRGGAGHKWTELVGYTYRCTSNCVGQTGSSSRALVRAGSRLETSTMALTSRLRAQAVQGGNLQALITQAATRYGARQYPQVDPGSCRCAGGTGNCIGCASKPINKDFQRARGLNGSDGLQGASVMTPLLAGAPGNNGTATIHVQRADGSIQEYTSCYRLELVDFDIEDENQDGIFEPGEHLFIRRIRVRNTGGMPSPNCRIPVSVVPSDRFASLDGDQGHAFLPPSIPDGNTITLEGSIKVLIRPNLLPPVTGAVFFQEEFISIQAVMPWLDRKLPYFEHTKTVQLQFPCELRNINCLSSIGQGSTTRMTWEIFNKSNKPIGTEAPSSRAINVNVTIPSEYGTLLTPSGDWDDNAFQDVAIVPALDSETIQQPLRILIEAESYQHVQLIIDFYISSPRPQDLQDQHELEEIVLVQRMSVRIQISNHYVYNPRSSFLLVTNSETTRHRSQALQTFISESLDMEFDTWNIDLYGGLKYQGEDGSVARNVISAYHGKTIVLLGNNFRFFQSGTRTAADLCDVQCLAEAIAKGTSCLLLEFADRKGFEELAKSVVLYSEHDLPSLHEHLAESRKFPNISELVKSIAQERQFGLSPLTAYSIPARARWFQIGKPKAKAEARRHAAYLRMHLPQERFLVTFSESCLECSTEQLPLPEIDGRKAITSEAVSNLSHQAVNDEAKTETQLKRKERKHSSCGEVVISKGLAHEAFLVGAELQPIIESSTTGTSRAVDNMPQPTRIQLGFFESYILIASIPLKSRVDTIWRATEIEKSGTNGQDFAVRATGFSILSDIEQEIHIFLQTAPCFDNVVQSSPEKLTPEERDRIFYTHLPSLAALLSYPKASGTVQPPNLVLDIFRYSIILTLPQKKRHIVREVLLPFYNRCSRLHRLLVATINHILTSQYSYAPEAIKEFHATARELYSRFDGEKRDTARLIVRRGAELTKKSEHAYEKSRLMASEIVPQTVYCEPADWDARVRWNEKRRIRVEEEMESAREALGRMIQASGI